MKKIIFYLIVFSILSKTAAGQKAPLTPKNKDRYAGLHFDFHAIITDPAIGKSFTAAMIDSLLEKAKPDFIQVDCKGHPGISSYPTKVGNAPEHIEKDILRIWREVTDKHHVPLFVHYSGVWDTRAIMLHPEWARINSDGKRDKYANSLLGGYPAGLMQPQIRELSLDYKVDGAWIDGDCWMLGNDYSPAVMEAFTKETGITEVPRKPAEAHYFAWMEFNRKLFRKYVADYVDAAHRDNPDFKITSNWSFSSLMPEKVDVNVDFLSGDVAGSNSLYSSAYESRCLALQGKPWDLMSWSFAWKNDQKSTKSVIQLKQEAAEVLAMGGGFQSYWQQNRDGTPEPYRFKMMTELIRFSQERKAYCYEGKVTPQIGLLFSTYAWKRKPVTSLYSAYSQGAIKGSLNMLMDSQLPVEILMDHQLSERIKSYPLLVLPEWENIDPQQKEELLNYVKEGGNLIVTGAKATGNFTEALGIEKTGELLKDSLIFAGVGDDILLLRTSFEKVKPLGGTQTVGSQFLEDDLRFKGDSPLATVHAFGKGKIAGVYFDMGDFYGRNKNPALPKLMQNIIASMGIALASTVTGSPNVHQVVTQKNNKSYIHLINTSGAHDNPYVLVYEEVPELPGITVSVRRAKAPKSVKLQPENVSLKYKLDKGNLVISMPPLKIHSIVEIED